MDLSGETPTSKNELGDLECRGFCVLHKLLLPIFLLETPTMRTVGVLLWILPAGDPGLFLASGEPGLYLIQRVPAM